MSLDRKDNEGWEHMIRKCRQNARESHHLMLPDTECSFIIGIWMHGIMLVTRVGLQQAQQFWDHVAQDPGNKTGIASTSILKGSAGRPKERGFSRTYHYELTSMARINYQFCDSYQTSEDGDPHREVFILTIDYTSH